MDKFTAMTAFAEVARRGNFGAAAEHLGMSRAMVTRHVAALENALGARLLNRTTRRLSLTGEGQAYLERCQLILAEIEETELAVGQLSTRPRGTLRISAPMSFGMFHLAPAIAAYQNVWSEVAVELVLNDRYADLAEDGVDVAIRAGQLDDTRLIARPLARARLVLCAAPIYLETRGVPRRPDELGAHNCLRYVYRSSTWDMSRDGENFSVSVHGDLESNVGDALREIAIAGRGIVMLPTYMVGEDLRTGRLRRVLADYELPDVPIYAVYLHRRHLSAKVRTFVDFLLDRFTPAPSWET